LAKEHVHAPLNRNGRSYIYTSYIYIYIYNGINSSSSAAFFSFGFSVQTLLLNPRNNASYARFRLRKGMACEESRVQLSLVADFIGEVKCNSSSKEKSEPHCTTNSGSKANHRCVDPKARKIASHLRTAEAKLPHIYVYAQA
jgi:hypothetical protein